MSSASKSREGRVVETRGRRVLVRDADGERVCFLAGRQAVVGDRVLWVEAQGSGGKIMEVLPRKTTLSRVDFQGRPQILAANLGGVLVVVAGQHPPFRAGLVDRYLVAARSSGLEVAVCLNKVDQGVPAEVDAELAAREALGIQVLRTSAALRTGIDALATYLAEDGPWALVGHSGVGKTSLAAKLMPGQDVGAIGELSSHWGTGQHTTTGSRLFSLPAGGEIADSPGIRTFTPDGLTADTVRTWFPGVSGVRCRYRDCQHRPDEDGCEAEQQVHPLLLLSYRRLLKDVTGVQERATQRQRKRRSS